MYIPYFLTKNQQTRRFSFAEHLEELISMVDHGPTAAGPMLGIRFRQEVSVDNKATCTSFGDENIFKAGGYR